MNEIEIAERLAALEQDKKSVNHRVENLEKLTESVYTLAQSVKSMQSDINNMISRITDIEKRPAKRWETIVTGAVTAVVGIIVGYLLRI